MKNLSFKSIVLMTFLSLCTTNSTADSVNKINNCIQLADEIEKVFDEIQIEAYQSEIYKSYSYIDATKLDYVTEALRINKIGIDGLEDIVSRYEINNKELQSVVDGFYNNFLDSRAANIALEEHLILINNQWTISEEVQWWEDNQEYSIKFWRTSDEYKDLLSSKSQNTLTPDPDFVVSDSYPQGILRKYCGSL
ncbi:hypothetical protein OAJ22_01355 [Acidimicrobiaceae bacterium]|jgi:hypothetical protein|nr:hypothetical protein [Acidimicrobiaceae bacterium]|tara:strand:- start:3544 stop:4125 length:582 start_codon:yes stop_codon:yes gene_type:complete